ncbi:MAG: hypothetical protein AAGB22_08955 [Bacteroidota bacterium]
MRGLIIAVFFVLGGVLIQEAQAQTDNQPVSDQGTRLFYRTELYGGAFIHTQGWGLNFRKGWRMTGFKKHLLSFEFATMKHPKQQKSFNPYYDDTRGFFFGKLNSLLNLRSAYGQQKVLFGKDLKRGVQISYIYMAGITLGLVKPEYLEIADALPTYNFITTERYDPERHNIDQIFGRAPITKGLDEIDLYPGFHGKFAMNFEYAAQDDVIWAIEVGSNFDLFHKEIPIMALTDNSQYFLTLYVNIQYGKKFF